jgi:hypothetical protein
LHLEQFIVESQFDGQQKKQSCHEFTSVGAFTTVHVDKSTQRCVDILMRNNKSDFKEFKSEVFLIFFALKTLILLLNDLKLIQVTDDKIKPILRCSKNIENLFKIVIPGLDTLKTNKIDPYKMDLNLVSLIERMNDLKQNFIQLNDRIKHSEFNNLDEFFLKILDPIVEFYVILII